MADYQVRVKVCDSNYPDDNCKEYPNKNLKPTGLLQKYGEGDLMRFGLISGAFTHPYNMKGGLLRKNIEPFADEVDLDTGIFKNGVKGIVYTIDRFRIVDFDMTQNYAYPGGWVTTKSMSESSNKFPDWGNPIGEMTYESLRYFSGKTAATTEFTPTLETSGTDRSEKITLRDYVGDSVLYLPAPTWKDPYTRTDDSSKKAYYCSPGAQLLISDVNPSFDTDSVPGSSFATVTGDISGFDATTEANAIWNAEHGGTSTHFIGHSLSNTPPYDGAPTAKTVTSLGNIRGLAPSEPTKQGGYYAAATARYGFQNDLRSALTDKQNINTFSVALASPLPRIEIPVGNSKVTLVPIAKSVGGDGGTATKGSFQATDQIVDFFVETFANTAPGCFDGDATTDCSDYDADTNGGRPYVKFRINYEDVEQGADHDMDAIAVYELKVIDTDTLAVNMTSEYAAGGIMQHMGYVISGTTKDGVYLEIRDKDTSETADPLYFLNTPAGLDPGACDVVSPPSSCNPLPLVSSRTFQAKTGAKVATILDNPLWYAAKYGSKGNDSLASEETSPNYFLVTNAGKLQEQLEKAFQQILDLSQQYGSSAAASSANLLSSTLLYTAGFRPEDWSGTLVARKINSDGSLTGTDCSSCWDAEKKLAKVSPDSRKIFTVKVEADKTKSNAAVDFQYSNLSDAQKANLNLPTDGTAADGLAEDRVDWLRGTDGKVKSFRSRLPESGDLRLLGDIVNSNPQFISRYYEGLNRLLGAISYRERPNVLYVGANDGMLHAFDATDGDELFAFVPSALLEPEPTQTFSVLNRLMSSNYTESVTSHRYSVDGTPAIEDVYLGGDDDGNYADADGGAWKTVLVGTQGSGGRSIFALDVTDPEDFDSSHVLWEFSDPDLGYTVGQPIIARLKTATDTYKWVAVFGNGYNSDSEKAILFIVGLDDTDGDLKPDEIWKIDTGEGSSASPNGLGPAEWTFWPGNDLALNRIYAGDLQGNLWRFDVSATSSELWDSVRLFSATDPDGKSQPITARPRALSAPDDDNDLILAFGTGSYFRRSDPADTQAQSFYAIRDTSETSNPKKQFPITKDKLLKQTMSAMSSGESDYTLRQITNDSLTPESGKDPYRGWYIDLNVKEDAGERIISQATVNGSRVGFNTLIPDADVCSGNRRGFTYEVDALSGGRSDTPVFDLNKDNVFDSSDTVSNISPSGIAFGTGEALTAIQVPGQTYQYVYDGSGKSYTREGGAGRQGRQTWQQLR